MTKDELRVYLRSAVGDIQVLAEALEQAWAERDAYKFASEQAMGMGTGVHIMEERDELKHKLRECEQERDRLESYLQIWEFGGLSEDILRRTGGSIKVGRGCLIISEQYLEEKDAEIAALKAKAELDAVKVVSTLCPLEDVEDFLILASNRLDDERVGGDRLLQLSPLDIAIDDALRLVQECLRE